MILEATSYPNRIRTISGVVNFVFPDDSIILCDTSTGAVSIDLAEIPSDFWNTIYKLYIQDDSGNAATHNITINAPSGYTINGSSSLVINQNDGLAIIRISSNISYLASLGYGTGNGLAIYDEGVLLTPTCSSIDFEGSNITATNIGNAVTVSVTNNFVTLNYVALTNLINTNTVVPNQAYLVTDAIFGSTPAISTQIVVVGITTSSVSMAGEGIFFNADYQNVGNYSGLPGYNSNLGIWNSSLTVVIGDVVIWNNYHYVNNTGVNGANNPNADVVNWALLTYSTTKGYIQEIDAITYDQTSNKILSRFDRRKNLVERGIPLTFNSLNGFQWGNDKVFNNKIIGNSCAKIMNLNVEDQFSENQLSNTSLEVGDTNIGGQTSYFKGNNLLNSVIYFTSSVGYVTNNQWDSLNFNNSNNEGSIISNNIISSAVNLTNNKGSFSQNTLNNVDLTIEFNDTTGLFENNNFHQKSIISVTTNVGEMNSNNAIGCAMNITTNSGVLSNNSFDYSTITVINNTASGTIESNLFDNSTFTVNINNNSFSPTNKGGGNQFYNSELNVDTNNSSIFGNIFSNQSKAIFRTVNASFFNNVGNNTEITINVLTDGISLTETVGGRLTLGILSQPIANGSYNPVGLAQGTIKYQLDCSDPAIYDLANLRLTIPLGIKFFCGYFILTNAAGLTINNIINGNSNLTTVFTPNVGTVTFNSVISAGAVSGQITSSSGAAAFNIKAGDFLFVQATSVNKILSSVIII